MNRIENILVIDSNQNSSGDALEQLMLHGYKVEVLKNCSEAREWLPGHTCDVILFDFHYNESAEVDFMTWVKSYKSDLSLLAMIEDLSAFEETRVFCENIGNVPLFCKQFAVLETIDHLERVQRAS